MARAPKNNRSKYQPRGLLPALRYFVQARNDAVDRELVTDNGGAIHSVERILDMLSVRVCYPQVAHYNSLKTCPDAHCSKAAHLPRSDGQKVEIEHLLPKRAYAQLVCEMLRNGATDDELLDFIAANFRLVLLTREERTRLDAVNRSGISPTRLADAKIEMHHID